MGAAVSLGLLLPFAPRGTQAAALPSSNSEILT
jgi:hypothetical protein